MEPANPDQSPQADALRAPISEPTPTATMPQPKFRSLHTITRIVQGLYLLLLVISLSIAALGFQSRTAISQIRESHSSARAYHRDRTSAKIFGGLMSMMEILGGPAAQAITLMLVLAVVGWIYQAAGNLPALQAQAAEFSPLLAVVLMLIPIVNIFAALMILNRIAQGSDPTRWPSDGNRRMGANLVVVLWWVLNLLFVGGALYVMFDVAPHVETGAEIYSFLGMHAGLMLFGALPLLVAWWMFGCIYEDQEDRWQLIASRQGPAKHANPH
jgi:hypothetical protein